MNTKIIMLTSALVLGATGIILTFASDAVLAHLNLEVNQTSLLLGQVIGALYFGFAMVNWMAKGSLIGGIYNRPVAVGNLTHFVIAGLAIGKSLAANPGLPKTIWMAGLLYAVFSIAFGIILFRHPVASESDN